ncbi:ShlB/FhaC/HecB family hemolysin secretion/activation protein, partial [Streptobacillus felis]
MAIGLNSDLKSREELDVSKIDTLVSNLKYAKSNNIDVSIEPSIEEDKSNIIITNKKTNPFKLSLGFDNYGENNEVGKYRYNISAGVEGLILN